MHVVGHVTSIANRPDDKACTAHNIASREHTVERRHHTLVIDPKRSPAGHPEIRAAKHLGQIFGIEAERLDDQIGLETEFASGIGFGRAATTGVRASEAHLDCSDACDLVLAVDSLGC